MGYKYLEIVKSTMQGYLEQYYIEKKNVAKNASDTVCDFQYREDTSVALFEFDGQMWLSRKYKLPVIQGKLSIYPYIGKLTPRHYDVTGTITASRSGTEPVESGEKNKNGWEWTKTWFDFKFEEVFPKNNEPYAKVVEIGEDE